MTTPVVISSARERSERSGEPRAKARGALGRTAVAAALALALAWVLAPGCSLDNREGPDVTCAMLECGRVNACKDGIIAGCPDGKTVQWTVCPSESKELCQEEWQTEGAYRCDEFAIDCEGCNPALAGCGTGG